MAKSQTPCPTVLLHDSPAEADEFSGRAHERLARALADMILNEKEGAAIALEGEWGSGKSSVVRMLHGLLAGHPRVKVITFDAWAHQGDPLRRTLLEALIAGFGNWLQTAPWSEKREEFSKRRRRTESTTTPRLTRLVLWLDSFFFLYHLGWRLYRRPAKPRITVVSSCLNPWLLSAPFSFCFRSSPSFFTLYGSSFLEMPVQDSIF